MLEYDRIDVTEGIDVTQNKLVSRECWLCHFWFFLDKNFNYQKYLCNGCHDISMKAMSMQNFIIKNHKITYHRKNAYCVNFTFMSKNDAYNLMKNANIIDKGVL